MNPWQFNPWARNAGLETGDIVVGTPGEQTTAEQDAQFMLSRLAQGCATEFATFQTAHPELTTPRARLTAFGSTVAGCLRWANIMLRNLPTEGPTQTDAQCALLFLKFHTEHGSEANSSETLSAFAATSSACAAWVAAQIAALTVSGTYRSEITPTYTLATPTPATDDWCAAQWATYAASFATPLPSPPVQDSSLVTQAAFAQFRTASPRCVAWLDRTLLGGAGTGTGTGTGTGSGTGTGAGAGATPSGSGSMLLLAAVAVAALAMGGKGLKL